MKLFAKFETSFPDDPKVIEAGDLAELAYMRCVLRGREALCDGVIDRRVVHRWLAGVRGRPETHMERLVAVGLLLPHVDGWQFPPDVWREWNPSKAEVEAKRQAEAERKRAYRERSATRSSENVPTGHGRTSATRDADATRSSATPEPEPEPEPEPYTSSSPRSLSSVPPPPDEEDEVDPRDQWIVCRVWEVCNAVAAQQLQERNRTSTKPVGNATAWKRTAAKRYHEEHAGRLSLMVMTYQADTPVTLLATHAQNPTPSIAGYRLPDAV